MTRINTSAICRYIATHCYATKHVNKKGKTKYVPLVNSKTVQTEGSEQLQFPISNDELNINEYTKWLIQSGLTTTRRNVVLPQDVLNDDNSFHTFLFNLIVIKCTYHEISFYFTTFNEPQSEESFPLFIFDKTQWDTRNDIKIVKLLYINTPMY